ncbi:MAG: GTP pyrophosphokinase, partial [Youngiibacter sp.]|nr:GTP pyrophosphokinase [Youngiibacter sp.]
VAATLHDLVEDTDITLQDLKDLGFKEEIVAAVDALTKRDDEKYMDYVKRATEDPIAIKVKLSDLVDNLGKTEELPDDEVKDKRRRKYTKALKFVEDAISKTRK